MYSPLSTLKYWRNSHRRNRNDSKRKVRRRWSIRRFTSHHIAVTDRPRRVVFVVLCLVVAAYTQLYVDPSVKKKQSASGDMKSTAATAGEIEAAKAAVSLDIPKFNIGVPIVIVGTKVRPFSFHPNPPTDRASPHPLLLAALFVG